MARAFHPSVEAGIDTAAKRYGIDPQLLRTFVGIESGGNPNAVTGQYKGLLQLSNSEFSKHGGGNIFDTTDNLNAGAAKLKAESATFAAKYGREPRADELYMIHQQGEGGSAAHWANPDQPAWKSMYSTAEGQQKGPGWSKLAIWGNVPDDLKRQYGSVDNMTSKQFTDMWAAKVGSGGPAPTAAPAEPAAPPVWTGEGDTVVTPPVAAPSPMVASASPPVPVDGPTEDDSSPLSKLMSAMMPTATAGKTDDKKDKGPQPVQIAMAPTKQLDLTKLRAMLANRKALGTMGA